LFSVAADSTSSAMRRVTFHIRAFVITLRCLFKGATRLALSSATDVAFRANILARSAVPVVEARVDAFGIAFIESESCATCSALSDNALFAWFAGVFTSPAVGVVLVGIHTCRRAIEWRIAGTPARTFPFATDFAGAARSSAASAVCWVGSQVAAVFFVVGLVRFRDVSGIGATSYL
jgi:hypothetical protein